MNPGIRGSSFVVMGVSGCGKSSVAQSLAQATQGRFVDADDYHSSENRKKMAAGIPLTDEERGDWLAQLNQILLDHHRNESIPLFLACSALKQTYRERLAQGLKRLDRGDDPETNTQGGLCFLFLNGSYDLIQSRMRERIGHFMPPELLQSQFDILEEPSDAIWFDVIDSVEVITSKFLSQFPELRAAG